MESRGEAALPIMKPEDLLFLLEKARKAGMSGGKRQKRTIVKQGPLKAQRPK